MAQPVTAPLPLSKPLCLRLLLVHDTKRKYAVKTIRLVKRLQLLEIEYRNPSEWDPVLQSWFAAWLCWDNSPRPLWITILLPRADFTPWLPEASLGD